MNRYQEESVKSTYLLQHYIINHFSFVTRTALQREFHHSDRDLPQPIHPIFWILGWTFEILCVLFFIAWILQWGTAVDAGGIGGWGINFALTLAEEIFIISLIRLFVINICVLELARPGLQRLHSHLLHMQNRKHVSRTTTEVEQIEHVMSPMYTALCDPSLAASEAGQLIRASMDSSLTDNFFVDENDNEAVDV
jgi:hypothetical protein